MDFNSTLSPAMFHRTPRSPRNLARRRIARPFLLLVALGTALLGPLHGASFHASLDASLIFANEQATLSLTIENAQPTIPPRPPPVPGLQFRATGQTDGVRFINGQRSTSLTYLYAVQATEPGDYTLPSIRIRIAGQELATEPLQLTVLPA
jgi:hypothetical protein